MLVLKSRFFTSPKIKYLARSLWAQGAKLYTPAAPLTTAFALLIQTATIVSLSRQRGLFILTVKDLYISLAISLLNTFALVQLLNLILPNIRAARLCLNGCLLTGALLLATFHLKTQHALDFSLVKNNFSEIFTKEAMLMFAKQLGPERLSWSLAALVLIVGLELGFGLLSRKVTTKGRVIKMIVAALLFFLSARSVQYNFHDTCVFLMSAIDYYAQEPLAEAAIGAAEYPYVKSPQPVHMAMDPSKRPHVFLIMMESFNALYVEAQTAEGKPYTPFFNSLLPKGLYIDHFYGNTVQTARGQFASLCGVIPSFRGKEFEEYVNNQFLCLPQILAHNGFENTFFKAYKNLGFDNAGPFLRRNGFDYEVAMDKSMTTPEDEPYTWGWGIQDDRFYQKVFRHLDARNQLERAVKGRLAPQFNVLHTVSNHVSFNYAPKNQRYLYPDSSSPRQDYANTLHLSDLYLADFFAQIRARPEYDDSLVIVMGDHSFPSGEHGNYFNEVGFYEESFVTPILWLWPGHLAPERVHDIAYSQLDLAPSLLDLLGISTTTPFIGVSLFDPDTRTKQHPIQLIQPYSGPIIGTVLYPMKYGKNLGTNAELLFNLKSDPKEEKNLILSEEEQPLLPELRRETKAIFLNQRLFEANRIWPGISRQSGPQAKL